MLGTIQLFYNNRGRFWCLVFTFRWFLWLCNSEQFRSFSIGKNCAPLIHNNHISGQVGLLLDNSYIYVQSIIVARMNALQTSAMVDVDHIARECTYCLINSVWELSSLSNHAAAIDSQLTTMQCSFHDTSSLRRDVDTQHLCLSAYKELFSKDEDSDCSSHSLWLVPIVLFSGGAIPRQSGVWATAEVSSVSGDFHWPAHAYQTNKSAFSKLNTFGVH